MMGYFVRLKIMYESKSHHIYSSLKIAIFLRIFFIDMSYIISTHYKKVKTMNDRKKRNVRTSTDIHLSNKSNRSKQLNSIRKNNL